MTFSLNFAPHLGLTSTEDGLFADAAGPDPVDQIGYAFDLGFRAIEDNFFQLRSTDEQKRIGQALLRHGMTMGCFLSILLHDRATFSLDPAEVETLLRGELLRGIDAAHRGGSRHLTVIAGRENAGQLRSEQLENAKRNLTKLAAIAEREQVVLLVEAISRKRWPDVLVNNVVDAYDICCAVDSPAVKVLFDVYQCQRESGDIITHLEHCWSQIGCIQIADNPGRCEPGTGEINFENVLAHIKGKRWTGLVEMEHAASIPGVDGASRVMEAYLRLDQRLRAFDSAER